jgi:two-component system, OmpR family, KDP operon response regulator KdpE
MPPEAAPVPDPEPRHKVLVVDDDPITCKTLSLKLTSRGYAVATAPDAAAAIGAVRDGRPDLVLLDLHFPPDVANGGMVTWDGFQTMNWLKGLEEAQGLPFIIISASDPADYEQRALASGAIAFFQKPIEHEKLLQLIGKTLEKRELPAGPKAA